MRIINVLLFVIISFGVNATEVRQELLNPKALSKFVQGGFYCFGRGWSLNLSFKAKISKDVLLLNFIGSNDDSVGLVTSPEEYGENPIVITGKKNIKIQLDRELNKHVFFKTFALIKTATRNYYHTIDGYKKSVITIPLPQKVKTLDHFELYFTGEKCTFGIRSIYLE